MAHDHVHAHGAASARAGARHPRPLAAALVLTLGFLVVQVITGLVTGSLALLSDAGHMATDALGLSMALNAPTPEKAVMPFMDPAFAVAVCRYDLSTGTIKLNVPVSQAYTSVTFYTRNGIAYYAINDRAAGRRNIELDLMTVAQHAQVPEEEDVTAADRLIIESPTNSGMIMLRALAPEPGLMSMARSALAGAQCRLQQD